MGNGPLVAGVLETDGPASITRVRGLALAPITEMILKTGREGLKNASPGVSSSKKQ
jgi:hypothetical protein